ncbi:MAG: LTA synthase family protein [Thomasclavelia sp.]|nr:LTA synthase family protein [Thomasclavelia sp.]
MDIIINYFTGRFGIFSIVLFFIFATLFAIRWGNRTFSVKTLNQIIFHLRVPMDGTDGGIFKDLFLNTFFQSLFSVVIIMSILLNFFYQFTYQNINLIMILCIIALAIIALFNYKIPQYILCLVRHTNLYEEEYIDPRKVELSFPKTKRNLIHIVLESVETTYLDINNGGGLDINYMPELTDLANNNINFSNRNNNGGPLPVEGTQWTIASQVAQSAGVPLLLYPNSKKYDESSTFFPGLYSLGDVLKKEGYNNEIIMGSDSSFGCTKNYYQQHGNYYILDHMQAIKEKRLPEDYHVFWGFEDKKVFEFARNDIDKLSKKDKPFNIEIVTIDTHTPDGYVCDECENKYDKQYANVISCQSKMVYNFVMWAKKQDWYSNTTIMITGDHNSMSEKFFEGMDKNYVRTPYNCFINSAVEPINSKNRQFATFDYYPTLLASMGVNIKGDRLGLGVNLFSDQQTLMEKYGYKKLNNEIKKTSTFYNQEIIK